MPVNKNIVPRPLTGEEKEARRNEVYDSFANYLVFCPRCRHMRKTNMYIMRAEAYIDELAAKGESCPVCGGSDWTLGYPMNSTTGFVRI